MNDKLDEILGELRSACAGLAYSGYPDNSDNQRYAEEAKAKLQHLIVEARLNAYADCGSKGGSGTEVREYAKSRTRVLTKELDAQSKEVRFLTIDELPENECHDAQLNKEIER